jgi:predicted HicB family RNase H-like nuclease
MCQQRATCPPGDYTIHHFRAHEVYGGFMPRRTDSEKRIATAVRLPQHLHDELQRQAEQRDVSVNYLVVRAVSQYLETAPDPAVFERSSSRSA